MSRENPVWSATLRTRLPRFSLDVELCEPVGVLAVVGENGSGKSTLLRSLLGGFPGTTGKIAVGEQVLMDTDAGLWVPMHARGFAYVPQGGGLFPHLSVLENVLFGALVRSRPGERPSVEKRALQLLDELGCAHLAQRNISALSGGETQKIALARALLSNPRFLLLDEPLSALDVRARREIRNFLGETLSRLPFPTVVVTHDARDIDALRARVCVLDKGRVLQAGDLDELQKSPASSFVRAFCAEGLAR